MKTDCNGYYSIQFRFYLQFLGPPFTYQINRFSDFTPPTSALTTPANWTSVCDQPTYLLCFCRLHLPPFSFNLSLKYNYNPPPLSLSRSLSLCLLPWLRSPSSQTLTSPPLLLSPLRLSNRIRNSLSASEREFRFRG